MIPEGTAASSAGARRVTLAIHEDELAWWLVELNLVRPPSRQWHRYQVITVNRGDRLTDWWHDMGPSEQFKGAQLSIPGIWEETVASLREVADRHRDNHATMRQRMGEHMAKSTLLTDAVAQIEEGKHIRENRSNFGPLVAKQRNGLDRRAFNELLKRTQFPAS